MRLLLILLLGFGLTTTTGFKPVPAFVSTSVQNVPFESVYICKSSTAYAFHASLDCRGLNKCTHDVIKVSREKALSDYGRKPCGYCY